MAARIGLLLVSSVLASTSGACGRERELREWRPEDHGQPSASQVDPSRVPADGPQRTGGSLVERAWNVACASCHGPQGRGDGPARPPGITVPDLTDPQWQASRSDAQIREAIARGRGAMPAFADQMPPPAIDALVRHVRSLGRANSPTPDEAPTPTGG
ncbi:MAG: cytochrome c [Myxococcota bacterium]|nr:cytochrome c [Myxococcota bacterium]